MNSIAPELQLKDTESTIKNKLKTICSMNRLRFKSVTILVLKFKEIEDDDRPQYSTFYLILRTEIIINGTDTDDTLESV